MSNQLTGFDADVRERLDADAREIVARYPQARSALLPLLHLVQSEEGFVSRKGIEFCAETLGLSTADVSAVATFYTQYKRRPNGKYNVGVCTNTLCAVMGGDEIFDDLSDHLGVGPDETTEDGSITLERVECNAACDFAPVMMVNWEFFDNQTPDSAREVVDSLRLGKDVTPTRGPNSIGTFKEVSRLLAGFPDGRANEGIGAGAPSLVGLELAQEQGWTAPDFNDDSAKTEAASGLDSTAPTTGTAQSSAERKPSVPADVDPDAKTSPEKPSDKPEES